MKKVLLASTALVATSGFAAAQGIELSGNAEMGIFDDGVDSAQFFSSVDVRFSMSGETDNGLTFGASIDLDDIGDMAIAGNDPSGNTGGEFADYSVFISGSFGTLTMGDTDGALDFAMSEVAGGTAIADDHTAHDGYNGNSALDGTYDGQIARYDYSFGDFAFAVSAELDDTGAGDEVIGVGGRWSGSLGGANDLAVGLGYQDNGVTDVTGVSVRAGFGDLSGAINYSDYSTGGDHTAVGVTYAMGAIVLHANWGEYSGCGGGACTDGDGVGLVANYDLGGGAIVAFGYGDSGTGGSPETWSLGLRMDF